MDDTKGGSTPLFHKIVTTKVSPDLPADTAIPMDSLRPIPAQKTYPEEEMEKKAIHTIHAQLKQVKSFRMRRSFKQLTSIILGCMLLGREKIAKSLGENRNAFQSITIQRTKEKTYRET